jgi:hypothetical protein
MKSKETKKMKSKRNKDFSWNVLLLIIGCFFIFITISAGLYGIERMTKYKSINELDFWALISVVIFWKLGDLFKDVANKVNDLFINQKSSASDKGKKS